jgi:hypothetical protein
MPAIDLNGTSPVELLEQHELAIAGLWSAISTLAATAPDARHYPARKPGTFQQAQAEHRDRLARLESVMDELEQLAEFISDQADAATHPIGGGRKFRREACFFSEGVVPITPL